MTANSTIIREQIIVPGEQTITIAPQWYHTKNSGQPSFFPVRQGNFIKPLICGLETKKAVWEAIENAKKSIEISLWGFDPAVMMGGYDENIENDFRLRSSLGTNSPRIGDLLLQARGRGVQVRLLNWIFGGLQYNPYTMLDMASPFFLIASWSSWIARLLSAGWLFGKVYDRLPGYNQLHDQFEDNPIISNNIAPNWRYRYFWWKEVIQEKNIFVRSTGSPIFDITDFIMALIANTAGFTTDYNENAPFLIKALQTFAKTHHQKIVLVDYEIPSQAVAFVMGQNLKAVDGDSFEHPAVAPPAGGRYPTEDPRQDISAKVYGPILYDINENYLKNWEKAKFFFESSRKDLLREKKLSASDFLFTSAETGAKSWPAQFSVTDMGDDKPGSIKDAYDAAIEATTKYFYFENQYFRYDELVKKMKAHAVNRFFAQSHEHANPLYYFVITGIPERMAKGTTYETLKELGHEQQMATEFSRQYYDLIYKLRSLYSSLPFDDLTYLQPSDPDIAELFIKIDEMDKNYPGGIIPPPLLSNKDPKQVENAEESFAVQDSKELKGHIITMMVYKWDEKGCVYNYVNIHSKLAIFDDAFVIIGSANLNRRSMHVDAEAVIGTSQEKLAGKLRKELFAGLLGTSYYNNKPIYEIYDALTRILKRNWRAQNKNKPLKGTANYLYDNDYFKLPTCD